MTFEMNIDSNHLSLVQNPNTTLPYSQEWYRCWRDFADVFSSITDGDNIYLVGTTSSFGAGYDDAVLIKYNSAGVQLWNKTWGGFGWDYGKSVAIDNNSNIYIAGFTDSFGAGGNDGFIVKYNSSGSQIWNRTWGSLSTEGFDGIAVDENNNLFLIGGCYNNGTNYEAISLVTFDSMGLQKWNITWDGVDDDNGKDIAIDNDTIYLGGSTERIITYDYDAILIKYKSSGTQLWNRSWGGSEYDFGEKVAVDNNSNCYLAGYTSSYGAGDCDAFLAKYDSAGNLLWNRTWGMARDNEICRGLAVDKNNIYITGYVYNTALGYTFLVKYDSAGIELWNKIWSGIEHAAGIDVSIDNAENIYICGNAPSDLFLVKYGIDFDNDLLTDFVEINVYLTDPKNPDTDEDGLRDGWEVNMAKTDPNNWDTDGDDYSDGWEVENGYNPLNSLSNPRIIMILSAIIPITVMAIILYPIIFKKEKKRERN
jgi:hypothetical protein